MLDVLEQYSKITIQCHDNPDADAIGAGYGLYCYFKEKGKDVRLIYAGRAEITKSNLKLLVEKLNIPIEYVADTKDLFLDGILVTVDCQYGAGNVTYIEAEDVAIIDHHRVEIENVEKSIINSSLGSCSTLVWQLLGREGYEISDANGVGTALYYGLFTDTNQFTEMRNPLDRDARDMLPHDAGLVNMLKNCNLSLSELEIAGIAMLRYSFNEEYGFAVIKAQPCDPNILGLISDFLLQVDKIMSCVVYNELNDGYKISVRSCSREVNASELAAFLTEGIGSGGGHLEKAGGFISQKLYRQKYGSKHAEAYFNGRMVEYFENFELIYAGEYEADVTTMEKYQKKSLPIGFVKADEILPLGTPITVRTLEGDIDITIEEDLYIIIGVKGEVYPNRREKFERAYKVLDKKYVYEECVISNDYVPTIKNRVNGRTLQLTDYAGVCVPTGNVQIYARPLEKGVKIFTAWDKEKYMLGKPGDYLVVRTDDFHDVYVVEEKIFGKTYGKIEE